MLVHAKNKYRKWNENIQHHSTSLHSILHHTTQNQQFVICSVSNRPEPFHNNNKTHENTRNDGDESFFFSSNMRNNWKEEKTKKKKWWKRFRYETGMTIYDSLVKDSAFVHTIQRFVMKVFISKWKKSIDMNMSAGAESSFITLGSLFLIWFEKKIQFNWNQIFHLQNCSDVEN